MLKSKHTKAEELQKQNIKQKSGGSMQAQRCISYTDTVSMTTIGAGAVTFIVGSVTGAALGASFDVIAISIAAMNLHCY